MRIQKEIDNVERVKEKIATMPLTMEDAIEFHKRVVDRVEKERKEINKELGIGDVEKDGFTGRTKNFKTSTPELKKLKLSESLFKESVDSIVTITLGFVNGNNETEDEIRDWLKSDYNLYLVKYDPNNFDDEATIRGTKEDLINYITGDYSGGDCDIEWIKEFYPELLNESLHESVSTDVLDELENFLDNNGINER